MTVIALLLGWASVALLVSPAGRKLTWKLSPRLQAAVAGAALVALVLIPLAIITVGLSNALDQISLSGSVLDRCGMLIQRLISQPFANPEVSLALVGFVAFPLALATGGVRAWRSQRGAHRLSRGKDDEPVIASSQEQFAFTVGLLQPRIVVSRGFLEQVPTEWQRVVMAHESGHKRGRHPLLVFVANGLALGMPVPPIRWAAQELRIALEGIADEWACRAVGDRVLVAEAIAGLALAAPGPVGFEGAEVRRVRRLLTAGAGRGPLIGLAVAAAILAMVGFAGAHLAHCGEESVRTLRVAQCQLRS